MFASFVDCAILAHQALAGEDDAKVNNCSGDVLLETSGSSWLARADKRNVLQKNCQLLQSMFEIFKDG